MKKGKGEQNGYCFVQKNIDEQGHDLKQFARNALRIEGEIYRPPGFCLEIWGKDNAAEFGVERKLHIFFRGNKHEPHAKFLYTKN